jgi:hypothetical protein
MGRENAVALANRYGGDGSGFELRCIVDIFFHPIRPDWLWGPPSLLYNNALLLGTATGPWSLYNVTRCSTSMGIPCDLPLAVFTYITTTPCSRALLEKLIFLQVGKIFPAFMETESSLPCSRNFVSIPSHINTVHALQDYLLKNYSII